MKKTFIICTHGRRQAECIDLHRNQIGIIKSGSLTIQDDKGTRIVQPGEVYILSRGNHYIQRTPTLESPYKELCLTFEDQEMTDALAALTALYKIEIEVPEGRPKPLRSYATASTWPEIETFFESLAAYINSDCLVVHPQLMRLKLAEFAYMVIVHKEYDLQHMILQCFERQYAFFESIIRNSVFENLTLEELAMRTNKGLTAFLNEFQRVFGDRPRRWIIKQRLLHARLLVLSTHMTISDIARKCKFENVSHFIKLFKREFGNTPLRLRQSKTEQA